MQEEQALARKVLHELEAKMSQVRRLIAKSRTPEGLTSDEAQDLEQLHAKLSENNPQPTSATQ